MSQNWHDNPIIEDLRRSYWGRDDASSEEVFSSYCEGFAALHPVVRREQLLIVENYMQGLTAPTRETAAMISAQRQLKKPGRSVAARREIAMLQSELENAYNRGEEALAQGLPETQQAPLSTDQLHRWNRFSTFAKERCCRALPARPTTVAAFVVHEHELGTPPQHIIALLGAIEAVHNDHRHSHSNPCCTAIVRRVLEDVVKVPPPRSWPEEDKVRFAELPPDIRQIIEERERLRDKELRRLQNKLADTLRLSAGSADKSISKDTSETKEVNTNVN
jgi:hypothetical protein